MPFPCSACGADIREGARVLRRLRRICGPGLPGMREPGRSRRPVLCGLRPPAWHVDRPAGTFRDGSRVGGRAQAGDRPVGRRQGIHGSDVLTFSPLVATYLARAELCALQGKLDEARAWADRAVSDFRQRSELEWVAWTLSLYPRIAQRAEEREDALTRARETVAIVQDIGNAAVIVTALGAVGVAEANLDRYQEALATLGRALDHARRRRVALFEEANLLTHLARAHLGADNGIAAHSVADEAVAVAHRQQARVIETLALITRARVRRATGGPRPEVDADLSAALELARATGATAHQLEIEAERHL